MRLLNYIPIAALAIGMAYAAEPVGTASSSDQFDLNGVSMRADGVSSWPVMSGDEIRSISAPILVRFQDGSRMTISQQSRVKLSDGGDGLNVNVTGGDVQYSLAPQSLMRVFNGGTAVSSRSGVASTRNQGTGKTVAPRAEFRTPPPPISSK